MFLLRREDELERELHELEVKWLNRQIERRASQADTESHVRVQLTVITRKHKQSVVLTCRPMPATAAGNTAQGYGILAIVTSNRAP